MALAEATSHANRRPNRGPNPRRNAMPTGKPTISLTARNISVEYGDQLILSDVNVTLTERSRLAIVGPNGVGKSSLLRVLADEIVPGGGTVHRTPRDLTVGLVNQELDRSAASTTRDLISIRTGIHGAQHRFNHAVESLASRAAGADDEYEQALNTWLRLGAADFDARLEALADEVGLPERILDLNPQALSGGQAARVNLMSVMLSRFDLTLLDEPTNDLDLAGLAQLEQWVVNHRGGIALISHDRSFLKRTTTAVLEIDEHHHTASLFQGGWQAYLDERSRAKAQAAKAYADYTSERDRLRSRSQKQREWADKGASRQKRHPADGDKHRRAYNLAQTEKLAAKAKATLEAADRLEAVDKPWDSWELRFTIGQAPRSGKIVATLHEAVLARGTWRLGPLDLEIHWADRVALVGPNGSGKSSIIDALMGRLALESGRATLGPGVKVGELDQRRVRFTQRDETLLDGFIDQTSLAPNEARSILAKFGIGADAAQRTAGTLSPGERTRAQLAYFQATGVNFLILDEPTNHLDLPAIEQLESALSAYDGTLLLVSHDRALVDNVELTRSFDIQSPSNHQT